MQKIQVIVSFSLNRELSEDIKVKLSAFTKASKRHPGCDFIEAVCDPSDPKNISFVELWDSQEAIDLHVRTPYFRDFVSFLASHTSKLKVKKLNKLEMV